MVESEDRKARSKGRRKEKKVGEGGRSKYGRTHPLPCRQRLGGALKPWKPHK